MLKKGQLVAFTRPMSTMRQVLSSVEMGNGQVHTIMDDTRLRRGQVSSALYNLAYIGAIKLSTDKQGRNHYEVPGSKISTGRVLLGVNSIFNCFTTLNNQTSNNPN